MKVLRMKAELVIEIVGQKNRAGQHPLKIEVQGPDGANLKVIGSRYLDGTVLDSLTTLPGGQVMRHTAFSGALIAAITATANGRDEESKSVAVNQKYQDETSERMMQRMKERMA